MGRTITTASTGTSHGLTARIVGLTCIAMLTFAANSILCRLALVEGSIDPASFTLVRILSGAAALWVILAFRGGMRRNAQGSWPAAFALFAYRIVRPSHAL